MTTTAKINLRLAAPLGRDLQATARTMRATYKQAADLGPGDSTKPGYVEHNREFQRLLSEARGIHSTLHVVAALIGMEATEQIGDIKWAVTHNGNGEPLSDSFQNLYQLVAERLKITGGQS